MVRVPLVYPKIPGSSAAPNGRCIAFEKYDGTNLHWAWDHELGWFAFGTRRNQFDLDAAGIDEFSRLHPQLAAAPELFLRNWGAALSARFPIYNSAQVTVFTEFLGEKSFAGQHQPDDSKRLVMFDVELQTGILPPERFIVDFADLPIARVVYQGKLTGKFAEAVRQGQYCVEEGVVCKGTVDNRVWMVKIKTNTYRQRLRDHFEDGWQDYWE